MVNRKKDGKFGKGNTEAVKDESGEADTWIQLRVPRSKKAQYVKKAQASEDTKGLTEWAIKVMDAAD